MFYMIFHTIRRLHTTSYIVCVIYRTKIFFSGSSWLVLYDFSYINLPKEHYLSDLYDFSYKLLTRALCQAIACHLMYPL